MATNNKKKIESKSNLSNFRPTTKNLNKTTVSFCAHALDESQNNLKQIEQELDQKQEEIMKTNQDLQDLKTKSEDVHDQLIGQVKELHAERERKREEHNQQIQQYKHESKELQSEINYFQELVNKLEYTEQDHQNHMKVMNDNQNVLKSELELAKANQEIKSNEIGNHILLIKIDSLNATLGSIKADYEFDMAEIKQKIALEKYNKNIQHDEKVKNLIKRHKVEISSLIEDKEAAEYSSSTIKSSNPCLSMLTIALPIMMVLTTLVLKFT